MRTHAESRAFLIVLGCAVAAVLASLAFFLWSAYERALKPLEASL